MKKNDWILIISIALYYFLFYEQSAGINFLIFNVALVAALILKDKSLLKNKKWTFTAIGTLFTAGGIAYFGNDLTFIANLFSLSLLSGLSAQPNSSVFLAIAFSFYSYCTSFFFIIIDAGKRLTLNQTLPFRNLFTRLFLLGLSLVVVFLFFLLYRASNLLFKNFTQNLFFEIDISDQLLFIIGGSLLLYGFFYHKTIQLIAHFDAKTPNHLEPKAEANPTILQKVIAITDFNYSGIVLFLLLNILLFVVNMLDFNFMFIHQQLPEGISHSQFVHQGIEVLIISIIFAISIILFYFSGALNFYNGNKTIRLLVYVWMAQNIWMLISTAFRNDMYIDEFGLTYKRIGVYIYLLLAAIGLFTTFIKIWKLKTNLFLFRVNGWIYYSIFVFSCLVNWDLLITKHNLNSSATLDQSYLLELSDANLPLLFNHRSNVWYKNPFYSNIDLSQASNNTSIYYYPVRSYEEQLDRKLFHFLQEKEETKWKSMYYEKIHLYHRLTKSRNIEPIVALKLNHSNIKSLTSLKDFTNLTALFVSDNHLSTIQELRYFPTLQQLDISLNDLKDIHGIEQFSALEYLNIANNNITDYSPLYALSTLEELYISDHITEHQLSILKTNLPNTQIIKLPSASNIER